jgi:prolipoprotein diacylglyceryltransferase
VIPYIAPPSLSLGPYTLSAFGILVMIAVVVGFEVAVARAPSAGIDRATAASVLF